MISKLHHFFYVALILFCLSASAAQTGKIPFQGTVVEAGIFEAVGSGACSAAPDTAAGRTCDLYEIRLVESNRNVKAELGVTFGFRYRLDGVPYGEIEDLEMRAIHPSMKGSDGIARDRSTAPAHAFGRNGRADDFIVYTLSEPFEVVLGQWHLQLLHKGRVVISQEFILQ